MPPISPRDTQARVYLVPGFFGFTSAGTLNYFSRVAQTLTVALARRGLDATVVSCATRPTASLVRRAERLMADVEATDSPQVREIHFVGHSTGGLDVRLLLTPEVDLRPGSLEEHIGARTRSAVTISTPHYGTPLASFFNTLPGRQVLRVLALLATKAGPRHMIVLGARLASRLAEIDDRIGRQDTFLDTYSARLLHTLAPGREEPLWEFLRDVSTDQGAVIQLTPEGMHLFNAAVNDRPSVRYASLVTAAPPPPAAVGPLDLLHPARLALKSLFSSLYTLSRYEHRHYPYPSPANEQYDQLRRMIPLKIDNQANDGVVPSLSQIHGELLGAVVSDHLDVVGQYANAGGQPFTDWLPSGSGFDDQRFEQVWDRVAKHIVANSELAR